MLNDTPALPSPEPSNPLRWFLEFWVLSRYRLRPQVRMLAIALIVGFLAGVGAIIFYTGCQAVVHYTLDMLVGYHPHHPTGEPPLFKEIQSTFRPWLLLPVLTLGGLLSGLMVYFLAPEAEGHGTDAAIAAFHYQHGRIRPQVPLVKLLASALTIGTGGSGGREGPIALIGAGIGSFVSRLFQLRTAESRVVMAAGMGAGIAAIFRAPLAGALFAAEVLYRSVDFEASVIVPAALASTTAYCTFGWALGWTPLFNLPAELVESMTFHDPRQLLPYLLLAMFVAVLAMLYTRTFYGLTAVFRRLPIPRHIKPAVGACATALVGLGLLYLLGGDQRVLGVLSAGYGILQEALTLPSEAQGDFSLVLVLLVVAFGKILTTALTIGSGGSGGVFGPSMVIGGCGGGALGLLLHSWWPALVPHPNSFVIVGMAGFFAAAAKTPISTLVIVSEMTGGYGLLLPALWVCVIAFLLSDEQSIYHSQVESRSLSPAHQGEYIREVLAGLQVKEFLKSPAEVPSVCPEARFSEVVARLNSADYPELPVVDQEGRYLGMVSLEEVLLASRIPLADAAIIAADLMYSEVPPLKPNDRLDVALELFVRDNRMVLPVVDDPPTQRILGIVKRTDISRAYLQRVHGGSWSGREKNPVGAAEQ